MARARNELHRLLGPPHEDERNQERGRSNRRRRDPAVVHIHGSHATTIIVEGDLICGEPAGSASTA